MVHTSKMISVPRDRLLYDEARLENVCDQLEDDGIAPKPTEIKRHVQTRAKVYEIRTAFAYWFGSTRRTRTCTAVLDRCEHVEDGTLVFDGDELVPEGAHE